MKKKISVHTLNNGFELIISGKKTHSYMYYDTASLIEGIMVHVGLQNDNDLTREDISNYVMFVRENPTKDKMVAKLDEQKHKIDILKSQLENMKNAVKLEHRRYYEYHSKVTEYLKHPDTALDLIRKHSSRHANMQKNINIVYGHFKQDDDDDKE